MDPALPVQPSPTQALPDGLGAETALIIFVEERRYAVRLADVLEVTPAAALMSPSGGASAFLGYLDLRGDVIPVFGARELLALPPRATRLSDRFVVVRVAGRRAAIMVDRVEGVEDLDGSRLSAASGTKGDDGLTVRLRVGAAQGEALVAMIDLDSLLADAVARPMEAAAS